jgi:hypothetical protein
MSWWLGGGGVKMTENKYIGSVAGRTAFLITVHYFTFFHDRSLLMISGKFFGRDFLKKRYEIVVLLEGVIEQTGNSIQVQCIIFPRGNKKGKAA